MSIDALLAEARAFAATTMQDTCRILRKSHLEPSFDRDTGTYTQPAPIEIYEGPCRVQIPGIITGSTETEAAEREWTRQEVIVALPVDESLDIQIEDAVVILTAEHDLDLIGQTFYVIGQHRKTHATTRRLRCEMSTP